MKAVWSKSLDPNPFERAGLEIMGRAKKKSGIKAERRWRSLFGATPIVCARIWELADPSNNPQFPGNVHRKHLMWALIFLRDYQTEEDHTILIGADENTFRKWQRLFVVEISLLESRVILWDSQKLGDIYDDALTSTDGTDFLAPNFLPFSKGWFSHKFKHSGL